MRDTLTYRPPIHVSAPLIPVCAGYLRPTARAEPPKTVNPRAAG